MASLWRKRTNREFQGFGYKARLVVNKSVQDDMVLDSQYETETKVQVRFKSLFWIDDCTSCVCNRLVLLDCLFNRTLTAYHRWHLSVAHALSVCTFLQNILKLLRLPTVFLLYRSGVWVDSIAIAQRELSVTQKLLWLKASKRNRRNMLGQWASWTFTGFARHSVSSSNGCCDQK